MTLDYEETLMRQGFNFINPNSSRSCGCGSSFSRSDLFARGPTMLKVFDSAVPLPAGPVRSPTTTPLCSVRIAARFSLLRAVIIFLSSVWSAKLNLDLPHWRQNFTA